MLGIVFCFVIPAICDISYLQQILPAPIVQMATWLNYGEVFLPVGAVFYYVLGHYINRIADRIHSIVIAVGYIFSLGFWFYMVLVLANNPDTQSFISVLRYGRYYGTYVSTIICLYSVFTFLFYRNIIAKVSLCDKMREIISHLGRNSVVIFLIHGTLLNVIQPFMKQGIFSNFFIETIVIVTIYFAVGLMISFIIERIPFINRVI